MHATGKRLRKTQKGDPRRGKTEILWAAIWAHLSCLGSNPISLSLSVCVQHTFTVFPKSQGNLSVRPPLCRTSRVLLWLLSDGWCRQRGPPRPPWRYTPLQYADSSPPSRPSIPKLTSTACVAVGTQRAGKCSGSFLVAPASGRAPTPLGSPPSSGSPTSPQGTSSGTSLLLPVPSLFRSFGLCF